MSALPRPPAPRIAPDTDADRLLFVLRRCLALSNDPKAMTANDRCNLRHDLILAIKAEEAMAPPAVRPNPFGPRVAVGGET